MQSAEQQQQRGRRDNSQHGRARAARHQAAYLRPRAARRRESPPRCHPNPPDSLARSPVLSLASAPPHPSATVAVAHRRHGHNHSLAPSPSQASPPRRLRPLYRVTRRQKLCCAATAAVSLVGRRRSSSLIRRLRRLPEPAELRFDSDVSSVVFSNTPRARFRSLAVLAVGAESSSPPFMSPPWPLSPTAATERIAVLSATPEAQNPLQLLLPCFATPKPPRPELRPPHSCSPPSTQTTPAPPAWPTRCARAPATRRTKPRSIWSTVGKFRAPPPSRASPATSRGPSPAGLTPLDRGLTSPLTH